MFGNDTTLRWPDSGGKYDDFRPSSRLPGEPTNARSDIGTWKSSHLTKPLSRTSDAEGRFSYDTTGYTGRFAPFGVIGDGGRKKPPAPQNASDTFPNSLPRPTDRVSSIVPTDFPSPSTSTSTLRELPKMGTQYIQSDAGGELLGSPPFGYVPSPVVQSVMHLAEPSPTSSTAVEDGIVSEDEQEEGEIAEEANAGSTIERDFVDDPDERLHNPTVYLIKFWRKVSTKPPLFVCYRNPARKAYSCKLSLHLPPRGERTFATGHDFPSKRSAKHAASSTALRSGILEQARQSMAALDQYGIGSPASMYAQQSPRGLDGIRIRPHRMNEQMDNTGGAGGGDPSASVENPISALNLALQKYAVETPAQALHYEIDAQDSPDTTYRIYHCKLSIRVTPGLVRHFSTSTGYPSSKQAKEVVTRLALQARIVDELKLHNSFTSKVCKQLGLPVPERVEEHDPVDEENSAGVLTQMVQEVMRNPNALQCEYFTERDRGTELFGARLTVNLGYGDVQHYEIGNWLRTKKDAKEAVCRVAMKSGLRDALEVKRGAMERERVTATRETLRARAANGDGSGAVPSSSSKTLINQAPPKPGTVLPEDADLLENAVGYLNSCMQMYLGRTDTLDFDFDALGPTNQSARQITARFGCKLSVKLSPSKIYTYTVDNTFPTKKSAKEAVAKVAVRQDIVRLAKEVKEGGGQSSSLSSASGSAGRSASPRTSLNGTYTVPAVTHTRAVPQGYPDLRAEDADGEAANGHAPYATTANRRSFGFSLARSPEHEHVVASPPPYSRHVSAPPSALPVTAFAPAVVRNPSQQQGIAPNGLLPAQQNPIIQQQRYMQQGRPDPHYLSSANGIAAPRNTMNTAEQRSALTGQHAPAASRAAAQPVAQQNQASAEQPYLRAIAEYAAARVTGPVQESVKYMIKRNPTNGLWGGSFTLHVSPDVSHQYWVQQVYPTKSMGEEAAATKAMEAGILAVIDREFSPEAVARRAHGGKPACAEDAQMAVEEAPVVAEAVQQDPHAQPVSYLHQACQIILADGMDSKPKYELTRKETGSDYGAILTVPTIPPTIYRVEEAYRGKAAAKEAVTRKALEDGVIEKLKETMITRLAPKSQLAKEMQIKRELSEQAQESDDLMVMHTDAPPPASAPKEARNKSDYVVILLEYCATTSRPAPEYKTERTELAGGTQERIETSVKIGGETYNLPKGKTRDISIDQDDDAEESRAAERKLKKALAKKIYEHLLKKDSNGMSEG